MGSKIRDKGTFIEELTELVEKHSIKNGSDTPDHIIVDYLVTCLEVFDEIIIKREEHYGRYLQPKEDIQLNDS